MGSIWLTSFVDQVYRYQPQQNKFVHYELLSTDGEKRSKVAFNIFEDKAKNLRVTSLRQGDVKGALYLFNRTADRFESFDSRLSDLLYIMEESFEEFWGAGLTWIVKIDRKGKRHQSYFIGNTIRGVFRDKPNELWTAIEGGGLILLFIIVRLKSA